MSDECPVCKLPLVAGCNNASGAGGMIPTILENGEIVAKTCPNMKKLRLRRQLESVDPQLIKPGVLHDRYSPLYQPGAEGQGKIDLTTENLFVRSIRWEAFLPHLKWVIACKGPGWFVRVVTDRTLLNIFVGNTSVKVRVHQKDADSLMVANSVEDYLKDPDLVIIRLGSVVHRNKAAANVLAESLLTRTTQAKPTWLIEPHDQPFEPYSMNEFGSSTGMVVCTFETREFVEEHFSYISLKTSVPVVQPQTYIYEDDDGNVTIGEDGPSEEGEAAELVPEITDVVEDIDKESEEEDFADSLWQESNQAKKKNWRKR